MPDYSNKQNYLFSFSFKTALIVVPFLGNFFLTG